jgi:uncharacterized protein YdaU (DUF1376 family)
MAKDKSPAFQFYPDSWLSSTDISLMNPAEEGAYIRLLCHEWLQEDCGLPDSDEELAILSRLGKRWYQGSGTKIRRKFTSIGGRLFNDRLVQEREKQRVWREKSAIGGKQSATKRQAKRNQKSTTLEPELKGGSNLVDVCLQPKSNSSSSSSSSNTNTFPFPDKCAELLADFPDQTGVSYAETLYVDLVSGAMDPYAEHNRLMGKREEWIRSERWHNGYIKPVGKWFAEKMYRDSPKPCACGHRHHVAVPLVDHNDKEIHYDRW